MLEPSLVPARFYRPEAGRVWAWGACPRRRSNRRRSGAAGVRAPVRKAPHATTTCDQLYGEAKRRNIKCRSSMKKAELQQKLGC